MIVTKNIFRSDIFTRRGYRLALPLLDAMIPLCAPTG
jgi:hypothetical protein